MSCVDPTTARQNETHPNVETRTMTSTHAWEQQQQLQLEVSHEMVTEGLVATVHKETNTEIEEPRNQHQPRFTEKTCRKCWESISLPRRCTKRPDHALTAQLRKKTRLRSPQAVFWSVLVQYTIPPIRARGLPAHREADCPP